MVVNQIQLVEMMAVKRHKLLIIDDDPVSGQLLEILLEKKEFDVVRMLSGNEALQVLSEEHEFELVLLDIMMPEISGLEVLQEIRKTKNSYELPVIMVTAKSEDSDVINALRKGANDYLTKPVNIDIAMARIRTQLNVKKMINQGLALKKSSTIYSMVGTLNHEINNPLAIAVGNISVLQKLMEGDPNLEKVNKAANALQRITELVKKMKELSESSKDLEEINYAPDQDIFKIE